jgi:hypothetical protein
MKILQIKNISWCEARLTNFLPLCNNNAARAYLCNKSMPVMLLASAWQKRAIGVAKACRPQYHP